MHCLVLFCLLSPRNCFEVAADAVKRIIDGIWLGRLLEQVYVSCLLSFLCGKRITRLQIVFHFLSFISLPLFCDCLATNRECSGTENWRLVDKRGWKMEVRWKIRPSGQAQMGDGPMRDDRNYMLTNSPAVEQVDRSTGWTNLTKWTLKCAQC